MFSFHFRLLFVLHSFLTLCVIHTPGNHTGNSKNNAISSLIYEFEKEVATIERRITNPNMICDEASSQEDSNGTRSNDSQMQLQDLPPDWIALEDPDSGDIYYSNEVGFHTCHVSWKHHFFLAPTNSC